MLILNMLSQISSTFEPQGTVFTFQINQVVSLMELESILSLECSVTLLTLMTPGVHDHMSRECRFEGTRVIAD